jgi:hypothetical protein
MMVFFFAFLFGYVPMSIMVNFRFCYKADYIKGSNIVQALEYRINWEIYTPYADAAGILLHINGKFTMRKLKSSLLS